MDVTGIVNPGIIPKPHLILTSALSLFLLAFGVSQFTAQSDRSDDEGARLAQLPAAGGSSPGRSTSVHTAAGLFGAAPGRPSAPIAAGLPTGPLVVPGAGMLTADERAASPVEDAADAVDAASPLAELASRVRDIQVKSGESLSLIFSREGIAAKELHKLLESEPLGARLKNIFPGHSLRFTLAEDDTLLKLEYTPGPLETLQFERVGDGFVGQELIQQPERSTAYKHGIIENSLFVDSQRAGLTDSVTMRLAQIFQWDIDFVLDLRKGDEFHVMFEELYVGDEFIGHGRILAAEFINQNDSYQAILYTDEEGNADYYAPDGNSMRKAFLRAPVEFSRISSNFNLRRVHPLFKRAMPHRGIDYAAPTGTPILAAGNGRVSIAGTKTANGNYVVLQHGEQFVTKYLHLSKFGKGIKQGARVKQGQVIGYVGATGWATAPHLHYEFLVNGVHQNPRTVDLPKADPVPKQEMARFSQSARPLLAQLDSFKQQRQLALAQ